MNGGGQFENVRMQLNVPFLQRIEVDIEFDLIVGLIERDACFSAGTSITSEMNEENIFARCSASGSRQLRA